MGRARDWIGGAATRLAGRPSATAVLLMYHRVAEPEMDPWGLSVSPANFAEQLEVLRRIASPVPLRRLVRARGGGEAPLPRRAVVVTLDDGYADALHAARPLLEAHGVPATVFVTTGNVGTDREFWWDELERLLLRPGVLPSTLELTVAGRTHRWELGSAARYAEADAVRDRRLLATDARAGTRHSLYHSIWKVLRPVPEDERRTTLRTLAAWVGDAGGPRASHRSLRPAEIEELARGGLVEIGAHTVTHPALPDHSPAAQRREIERSRDVLRQIVGGAVTSFSYPHGECSRRTVALVRRAGFGCACGVEERRADPRGDPLRLPRFFVLDWSGAEFERRLSAWLGG